MSESSAPGRAPLLPQPPERSTAVSGGRYRAAPGSGAIRLTNLRQSSPTAITRPEMPAVRPSQLDIIEPGPPETEPKRPGQLPPTDLHSGRVSWAEAPVSDPITEQTGRVTEMSLAPVIAHARDRALLLRMDGVHAGQVIALNEPSITLGRHPHNSVVIDDTGVSRYHAEIVASQGGHLLIDKGARNGTLIQGKRVEGNVTLCDGDFVQLGPRVGFRFSVTDAKQEKLLRRLYESSNRDALTGAYNRKHFDERLLSELAYAARHKTSTALLLFDIDHFKRVNDTHGHAAGDAVLRQVAGVTLSRLRTEDVFARVGGEEFAVLLRGVNLSGSAHLAERLRTSIAAVPTMFEGKTVPVSISIGCAAVAGSPDARAEELIRLADERLYRAKNGGRNRVVVD